jgi:cysteinyl-tRNA synthetase, unknown class
MLSVVIIKTIESIKLSGAFIQSFKTNPMKKIIFAMLGLFLLGACSKEEAPIDLPEGIDLRQEMRDFVIGISQYAKNANPNFQVIPQNGIELVSSNGEEDGSPASDYLDAIDGHGQEDLFYGYNNDNQPTPGNENEYLRSFLDLSKNEGNTILVTDYCSTSSKMDDSYNQNTNAGYISFAADDRELNQIPAYPATIHGENNAEINSLAECQNFLYLINPGNYATKSDFITAVTATNYDLIIMDLFFNEDTEFTATEINQLKQKANGGIRLVVCYMSIGEAEDYRYYWQNDWNSNKPLWMDRENPDWAGNFKVKYWDQDWQNIIYGNNDSYLKKILNVQFDGVYLDIIDAFEFYE